VFVSPARSTSRKSARPDYWRMGRALLRRRVSRGDLVHNSFSYHFTPAGAMMDSGAVALGCTVFPAAPARPSCSCRRWPTCRPDAYVGTPSFLRILLEKADETGIAAASLKKASLGGEAFPAGAARLARGARHRRLPELRHRRPRPRRLRDRERARASSSTRA
jgi:phenylacetate-CoA ligase